MTEIPILPFPLYLSTLGFQFSDNPKAPVGGTIGLAHN
jgi:hypothetical protein